MNTIKPIKTFTQMTEKTMSEMLKNQGKRYQYLRPDGKNIDEILTIVDKPYIYTREGAPTFNSFPEKTKNLGENIDFYVG